MHSYSDVCGFLLNLGKSVTMFEKVFSEVFQVFKENQVNFQSVCFHVYLLYEDYSFKTKIRK